MQGMVWIVWWAVVEFGITWYGGARDIRRDVVW